MDYLEIRELYHHGIKGQRWGIRRFQNEDGTLTEAGKARYGTVENMQYERKKEAKSKGRKIGAISGASAAVAIPVIFDIKEKNGPYATIVLGPAFAIGGAAVGSALGHIGGKIANKIETNKNNKQIALNTIDKLQKQLEDERKKQQDNEPKNNI